MKKVENIGSIAGELTKIEKRLKVEKAQAWELRISNFGALFDIEFVETSDNRTNTYVGLWHNFEIRIGGLITDSKKRIIIIDNLKNVVVYTGEYTNDDTFYKNIIDVYNKRSRRSTAYIRV